MTPWQFAATIKSRDIHTRTWIGRETIEVWADGQFHSWWTRKGECSSAIYKLLGLTDAEGKALCNELWAELHLMIIEQQEEADKRDAAIKARG